MIMNWVKKYSALLSFSCMLSIILHLPAYCMNTEQNHKSVAKYAQNIVHTVDKTAFFFMAVLLQLPHISGSTDHVLCYNTCIANCTTYEPFLCTLEFMPGIFLIAGTGAAACAIGTGLGYGLNYVFEYMKDKEKTDQILSENSLLIQ